MDTFLTVALVFLITLLGGLLILALTGSPE